MKTQVMKNIWLMMCAALTVTLLTGCSGDEPVEPTPQPQVGEPKLTLAETEVSAEANGGHFEVGYTLENPKEGAKLLVTPEFDWVRNISLEVDGTIAFDVAASYEAAERTCRVDVAYPGVYPNATFVVKQSVGMEHAINIVAKEVNATNILFDIIPKDPNLSYVFILGNGKYVEENGLMEDDEALWASDMDIFQGFAEAFGSDVASVMPAFMFDGVKYDYRVKGVSPNTKYVAYAYGFDVSTMKPTTEICRLVVNTRFVEDYVVEFELSTKVDGPYVEMDIKAVDYDGPFFFGLFDAKSCPKSMPDDEFRSYCSAAWEEQKGLFSSFFETPEQGLHFIFNELAYFDEATWAGELDADTEWVLWAFGMDSEALINSTPVRHYFKTGSAKPSDNTFTVTVSDILSRRAKISVDASNDDPWVAVLATADKFENNTDSEIMQYIVDNYNVTTNTGDSSEVATGLTPSTDYKVYVFGYQAGSSTTALTTVSFTTKEIVYADLSMSIAVKGHYDIEELMTIDSSWGQYSNYDAMVVVEVTVDEDAAAYYFSADTTNDYAFYTYDKILTGLVYEGAAEEPIGVFPMDYNTEYTFFGVAENGDGDFTKVVDTPSMKFAYEDRSDVKGFADATTSKSVQKSLVYAERAEAKVMVL